MVVPRSQSGVYGIYNVITGKIYIGSTTKTFATRWKIHRRELRAGLHGNRHLQAAWNKYGEDCWQWFAIEYCQPEKCVEREQAYIDFYKAADSRFGYNICPVASSALGVKRTDRTKAKIGAASLGRRHTPETKAKIAEATRNRDPAINKRVAEKQRGRPCSEEAKRKIGAANAIHGRGRKASDETRRKMSKTQTGRRVPWIEKLTKEQVLEIRRRYKPYDPKDGGAALAREFGITPGAIMAIISRRNWRHI